MSLKQGTRKLYCDFMKQFYHIRLFFIMECILFLFLGIFYFSCGETLYIRKSDGNIEESYATGDLGELTQGITVEQVYVSQMDRIDTVGVMVSNYGQPLSGELYIRCEDLTDGHLIVEKVFSLTDVGNDQYLYLDIPEGIEEVRGNQVKLSCTSNGMAGNAPTVLYRIENMPENKEIAEGAKLYVNGEAIDGIMCFTVQGRDYVWTGPNYWKIVLIAAIAVLIVYVAEEYRCRKGKKSVLFGIVHVLKKYGFLVRQLVQRDFKVRYKRSLLGVFWSFLNPLIMMSVQYMIFSQLFRSDIDNYPVYLLSGLVVFNFFSEGVGQALSSIIGNAALITKVYIPKYIYPVTRVLSSGINLLMSLIPLVLVALLTGESMTKAYLMLPYILFCCMVFTVGIGMALAAGMTFFRDVQFLWGILSMLWMYLTPLFYPVSIVPDGFQRVITANPMYFFVHAVRNIVMEGMAPRPIEFCECTMAAAAMLVVGSLIFKSTQDRFIFYI